MKSFQYQNFKKVAFKDYQGLKSLMTQDEHTKLIFKELNQFIIEIMSCFELLFVKV